jgi:hypothetical protein
MRVRETSGIPVGSVGNGMWANALGREGAPKYLHAIYTALNVCMSVW